MVDISIVNGIVNQLITGGHHLVRTPAKTVSAAWLLSPLSLPAFRIAQVTFSARMTGRTSGSFAKYNGYQLTAKPIGSMYAIYGNIYNQYTPNVRIYTSPMDPMGNIAIQCWGFLNPNLARLFQY